MPKVIHQTNTKQILKEAHIFLPLLATTLLTIASASVLSSHTSTALDQKSISASVKVSDSCSMQISDDGKATLDNPYEMIGGTYDDNVKNVNISMSCNDRNGFSLYAVGFSNNEIGNTNLISSANGNIPTGLDTTTLNSNWSFKFTPVTTSSYVPTILSDAEGSFASFHKIPSTNTKVATFTDAVEVTGSSSVTATYAVGVSPYQAPDTYTGQVKFTLVHPNFADSEQRVYMQDLTPTMIADLLPNVGNTFTAYDKRDNQSYKIAKLADGKYWMLDNLRLGSTELTTDLTSENTNLIETISASDWNSYSTTENFNSYTAPMFNNASANTTTTSYGSGSGKIGVYYNYCVASAGTYCMPEGYGTGNASYDICPKGWRMPTSGSTGEYQALFSAYSGNVSIFLNALSMPLSGRFYDNTTVNQGLYGNFWSSTYSNSYDMYISYVSAYEFQPTVTYNRDFGNSVRCLFETRDITDISTMQEISPAIAANTPVGTTATLTDSRGGVTKSYTVAKLADNKVWMTSNLDLPGGTTITSNDSDVTTNFTLPTSAEKNADNNNLTDSTQFSNDNTAYVFNSGNNANCGAAGQNIPCGSYYSYVAATAGTNPSSGAASSDICPYGWRLPTEAEYDTLVSSYDTGAKLVASPFYGVYSGFYSNGSFYDGGSVGYYWSSTAYDSFSAYYLYFNSSSADTINNYKSYGFAVRCVAKS